MRATVEQYVLAADRDNTVKSYAAALRNFEEVWKGLLPATADTVARYLAEHAEIYRLSTLRLHMAALARWHADNGFADPTRSPLVHKVLRGIRAKHAVPQKHARPLQLDVLEDVSGWLLKAQDSAGKHGRQTEQLRRSRDRALLLLGFWPRPWVFRAPQGHLSHTQVMARATPYAPPSPGHGYMARPCPSGRPKGRGACASPSTWPRRGAPPPWS